MTLVFYISGHGLGHASRDIELIEALLKRAPGLKIAVRSSVASWVFERIRGPRVEVTPCETDPGVVQVDSLRLDEDETARRAATFYSTVDRRVRDEAAVLRRIAPALVIADAPPIAIAAAHAAGMPSVLVSNFTWDWIYAFYPQFDSIAPGVVGTIADGYRHATLALRLPIPGGFESIAHVTEDIPFIARRSHRPRAETRQALGLNGHRLMVLSSFGGYGLELPFERIAADDLDVVSPPRQPPAGLRYEDLVAAADVVVSKPGYGIVSECVANERPLLFTSRGRFAEYDVMLDAMPRMLRCRFIEQDDLLGGNWRKSIDALLAQPAPAAYPPVNGAEIAAEKILALA